MPYKITCPLTIASSHIVHDPGFRGANVIKLATPLILNDPLGFHETRVEITEVSEQRYRCAIVSASLSTRDAQVDFLVELAEYLSFLMARGESNPHYGTSFIEPVWFEFDADAVSDGGGGEGARFRFSESLSIQSTRTVTLSGNDIPHAVHTDLLRFYVDGLRAEHKKSKYFHWFLILEYLENSDKYRALFNANKLFDDSETTLIKDVASRMNGTKKSAILNLLARTREFRSFKLATMLHSLGITRIESFGKNTAIDEDTVKGLTNGRNALFHSGAHFPDGLLWLTLFPLVTMVVEKVTADPSCLDA